MLVSNPQPYRVLLAGGAAHRLEALDRLAHVRRRPRCLPMQRGRHALQTRWGRTGCLLVWVDPPFSSPKPSKAINQRPAKSKAQLQMPPDPPALSNLADVLQRGGRLQAAQQVQRPRRLAAAAMQQGQVQSRLGHGAHQRRQHLQAGRCGSQWRHSGEACLPSRRRQQLHAEPTQLRLGIVITWMPPAPSAKTTALCSTRAPPGDPPPGGSCAGREPRHCSAAEGPPARYSQQAAMLAARMLSGCSRCTGAGGTRAGAGGWCRPAHWRLKEASRHPAHRSPFLPSAVFFCPSICLPTW